MRHANDREQWWKLTVQWVNYLWQEHKISVLPIRPDAKAPMLSINKYPDHLDPDVVRSFGTWNIAVRCGHLNRLLVLDVDNPSAAQAWFTARKTLPNTWMTITGSGGRHLYYRVPDTWNTPIYNVDLWKGQGKHEEVKLLGDRKHAICPPSRYGPKQYKWANGSSPLQCRLAYAPYWLLKEMIDVNEDNRHAAAPQQAITDDYVLPFVRTQRVYDANLLERIPNKLDLLVAWGLRLAGKRANSSGWLYCYRPGNDKHPSASVRPDTGQLWIAGVGTLNFFEATVALRVFPDVQSAIEILSETYK
jgi:hypothetical protein